MYWFAQLWRYRWMLILPMILVPAILLGVLFTLPPQYMATAVVQLNNAGVRNLSDPNLEVLEKTLQSGGVLDGALAQVGQSVDNLSEDNANAVRRSFAKHLQLVPMENNLLRINYVSTDAANAEDTLTTISLNFVQELMAPLRFRTDQNLSDLESDIKQLAAREKEASAKLKALHAKYDDGTPTAKSLTEIVATEFEVQRLTGQRDIAQEEYDGLLAQRQKMSFGFHIADPAALMWFVEPPQLVNTTHGYRYGMSLKCLLLGGAALGFVLGLLLIALRRATDNTFRDAEEVQKKTGLQVLGNLPDLGQLNLSRGHLTINN